MTRAKWAVFVLIGFLLFAGVVTGGGRSDDRPGESEVYDRIGSLSDCSVLQAELDAATEAADQGASGSEAVAAAVSYEQAAWDRMVDQGCVGG